MSEATAQSAMNPVPVLYQKLRDQFGTEPARLPIVTQELPDYDRANLQVAIETILQNETTQFELIGIGALEDHSEPRLSSFTRIQSCAQFEEGPVEYSDVPLPENARMSCVKQGLYLVRVGEQPFALFVRGRRFDWRPGIVLEVLAPDRQQAEKFLRRVAGETLNGMCFRGKILSLTDDCNGTTTVHYHELPRIDRQSVILPESLLTRIERNTTNFARHAEKLRLAQRHVKRGILLYGPPGTGKTLSAMYIVSQMVGRTTLIVTGATIGSIETACRLARQLAPSTVILEDVDLIGTERGSQTVGANALLFEMLNQMDGLSGDCDILFVLTTNRPEILEPALASRPGRIDQAIEVPLPDSDCRRRLFELYRQGMRTEVIDWEGIVTRTEGVSAAFIRELLRKAAVFAADEEGELIVRDSHLQAAHDELFIWGGEMTKSLLGAQITRGAVGPS